MGMNVNLTPELETLVRRKVASGMYTSASEVVREALRLMEEQDQMRAVRLEQLRQEELDRYQKKATPAESKRIGPAGDTVMTPSTASSPITGTLNRGPRP